MPSESANTHAGRHENFMVFWSTKQEGWYWEDSTGIYAGPFDTSQAAYDNRKQSDEGYQCHVQDTN